MIFLENCSKQGIVRKIFNIIKDIYAKNHRHHTNGEVLNAFPLR